MNNKFGKIKLNGVLDYCLVNEINNFDWCDENGEDITNQEALKRLEEHGFINGEWVEIPAGIYDIEYSSNWDIILNNLILPCEHEFEGQVEYEKIEL